MIGGPIGWPIGGVSVTDAANIEVQIVASLVASVPPLRIGAAKRINATIDAGVSHRRAISLTLSAFVSAEARRQIAVAMDRAVAIVAQAAWSAPRNVVLAIVAGISAIAASRRSVGKRVNATATASVGSRRAIAKRIVAPISAAATVGRGGFVLIAARVGASVGYRRAVAKVIRTAVRTLARVTLAKHLLLTIAAGVTASAAITRGISVSVFVRATVRARSIWSLFVRTLTPAPSAPGTLKPAPGAPGGITPIAAPAGTLRRIEDGESTITPIADQPGTLHRDA